LVILSQESVLLCSFCLINSNFLKDFDDWDDVGLNIPQPPNLVRLYRDYDKHAMPMAASTLAKTEEENAKLVSTTLLLVDVICHPHWPYIKLALVNCQHSRKKPAEN
jgi:hypothetical protein